MILKYRSCYFQSLYLDLCLMIRGIKSNKFNFKTISLQEKTNEALVATEKSTIKKRIVKELISIPVSERISLELSGPNQKYTRDRVGELPSVPVLERDPLHFRSKKRKYSASNQENEIPNVGQRYSENRGGNRCPPQKHDHKNCENLNNAKSTPHHRELLRGIRRSYCNSTDRISLNKLPPYERDLTFKLKLQGGAFGQCYVVENKKHKKFFAKVVTFKQYRPSEVDALISCANQENCRICVFFGAFTHKKDVIMIMEFLYGRNLRHYIAELGGHLDLLRCMNIFSQLWQAVSFMHRKNFLHGDIKPENIVFANEHDIEIKLTDFGFASYNTESTWLDSPRFTLDYAPPEAMKNSKCVIYSKAFDIWCMGTTLYTMYMGHTPFRSGPNDDADWYSMKHRIINSQFHTNEDRWNEASVHFRFLVKACLCTKPEARPTIKQLPDLIADIVSSIGDILLDEISTEDSEDNSE